MKSAKLSPRALPVSTHKSPTNLSSTWLTGSRTTRIIKSNLIAWSPTPKLSRPTSPFISRIYHLRLRRKSWLRLRKRKAKSMSISSRPKSLPMNTKKSSCMKMYANSLKKCLDSLVCTLGNWTIPKEPSTMRTLMKMPICSLPLQN